MKLSLAARLVSRMTGGTFRRPELVRASRPLRIFCFVRIFRAEPVTTSAKNALSVTLATEALDEEIDEEANLDREMPGRRIDRVER